MLFKIGGLTPKQYDHFLYPTPRPQLKGEWQSDHWMTHFNLASYPLLAVFINRLAYFLLHRFSAYPNNAYLFEKFKTHDFKLVKKSDQIQETARIFEKFKLCLELDLKKITGLEQQLQAANILPKAEKPVSEDGEGSAELGKGSEDKADSEDKKPPKKKVAAKPKSSDSERVNKPSISNVPNKSLTLKEKSPDDLAEQVLDENQLENIVENDAAQPLSKMEQRKARRAERRKKQAGMAQQKKKEAQETRKTFQPIDKNKNAMSFLSDSEDDAIILDDFFDADSGQPLDLKSIPVKMDGDDSIHLDGLKSSVDDDDDLFGGFHTVLEPLPDEILNIITISFPFSDPRSIVDVLQDEDATLLYKSNLMKLVQFAKKLEEEGKIAADPRFEAYMHEMDGAFQRALKLALDEAKTLHSELLDLFPDDHSDELENGEVLCTGEQLDWVVQAISDKFPALYHLAFDASICNIFQSYQLASFARQILLGCDEADANFSSPCFIRLAETHEKTTKPFENKGDNNPLVRGGSYLLTQFIGSHHRLEEDEEEVKRKLANIAQSYVQDWLKRLGWVLEFGTTVIDGGQSLNPPKASDWAASVRDVYTNTLLGMSKDQLEDEIIKPSLNCPFIQLIKKTYEKDISSDQWKESEFPAAILEKIFHDELLQSFHTPLHSKIEQTLKDAQFADPADIAALAKKAGCSPKLIEPLIRIRIFYMMCCLGQNATNPAVQGLHVRAKTMVDPSLSDNIDDPLLVCQSSEERTFAFDERFERMQVFVSTSFEYPEITHPIAQGESVLSVSSLNCRKEHNVETSVIDLQDLRFSIYATPSHRRYLTAQIEPRTLIEHMKQLVEEVNKLEIVRKSKLFRSDQDIFKRENAPGLIGWFFGNRPTFNVSNYQNKIEDIKNFDHAIPVVNQLAANITTSILLKENGQLSQEQRQSFKIYRSQIRTQLDDVLRAFGEIYSDDEILNKIALIRDAIEWNVGVDDSMIVDNLDDSSDLSSDDAEIDSDLGVDTEFIGKDVGNEEKSFSTRILSSGWNVTFGLLVNETSEVKFLRWKIERYEDLIVGAQSAVRAYFKRSNLGEIDDLIYLSKQAKSSEWLRQLSSILEFCQHSPRMDEKRLNGDYLNSVRSSYRDKFLAQLRVAASWAKDHPATAGAEHVNGICHALYSTMDLNSRCEQIFQTFIAFGKEMKSEDKLLKHPLLTREDKYALINDLFESHQLIHAVPNGAKAPKFNQMVNSFIGHINGLFGMAIFDPNMQSNPMHVFFSKKVKKKGAPVHFVKDIAMGSPTIETGNGIATINPEFQGFLRHCHALGQKHLYINNQNFQPKSMLGGDESVRCQALHDLAEIEFKDTLHVITLNQNSWFYEQKGHDITRRVMTRKKELVDEVTDSETVKQAILSQLLDGKCEHLKNYLPPHLASSFPLRKWMDETLNRIHREEFDSCIDFVDVEKRELFIQCFHKKLRKHVDLMLKANPGQWGYSIYDLSAFHFQQELIAQMFDYKKQESGNCIPDDLVQNFDLRNWSVGMAKEVHKTLFGGRDELTVEERRIFIRLFYRNLARKILIETEVNSYNESCKDRIDRGAASEAEDYAYLAILNDCANEPHVIDFFKMLVFARAIIVRKRTIIDERLERLIETVKFMIDHQGKLKDLQGKLFPNVNLTIDQFQLKEDFQGSVDDLYG